MQCQNCKMQLPEKAKFCTNCGAKINVRLCPNGHVIEPGESVCRYCPTSSGAGTKRMSVSTTIDKSTVVEKSSSKTATADKNTIIEKPFGKTTVVEVMNQNVLKKTSIFDDQMSTQRDSNEETKLFGWLVITEGKELWKTFPIIKTKLSVGRSSDCDIFIDDEHLSTKHASLKLQNNVLFITDLDSSNGTYVNDQTINRCALSDNDIIKMGNTIFKLKIF